VCIEVEYRGWCFHYIDEDAMKPEEIEALERRNNMNDELILEKLGNIDRKVDGVDTKIDKVDGTVQENYRALRGSNGDAGIVASVDKIEDKLEDMKQDKIDTDKKYEKIKNVLHGEGKDDAGIVGEQLQIRKVQKWTIGLGTAIIIAVAIQLVTSLIGG
jgi:hypothetical protein